MKNLSNKEKNRRKFQKMYKSVENKLHDSNLIWWNSLSMKARYSFLFKCISAKSNMKFKHFLKENQFRYQPSISKFREASIEHLLK